MEIEKRSPRQYIQVPSEIRVCPYIVQPIPDAESSQEQISTCKLEVRIRNQRSNWLLCTGSGGY